MNGKPGYLLVDDRMATGRVLESDTYTCSHCHSVVVLNAARTRERAWCRSCDHVVCDGCGLLASTRLCVPMNKLLEDGQTAAYRALGKG